MNERTLRQTLSRPLAFATGVVCLASLLACAGRWSWACELLVNFRTQFALLLALASALAILLRCWGIAGVAILGAALNAWQISGAYLDPATPRAADERTVRLVEFNVNVGNRDLAGIARYLESLDPDVVVLEEMTTPSTEALTPLLPRLTHRHAAIEEDVRGVVVFSRWPLLEPRWLSHEGQLFGVRAEVDLGDRRLRLFGVHLNWPVMPRPARGRNAQLQVLGRELSECRGACVVVGDFNTTPWSSHYRDLLNTSGFRDCTAGLGLKPTWPSALPALLRIRIDHCLASAGVSVAGVADRPGRGLRPPRHDQRPAGRRAQRPLKSSGVSWWRDSSL
jgi:endonuclease/exonuclease/phosphatase (EEP) superfamily protein YafD